MGSKNGEPVVVKGKKLSMVDVVSLYPFVMMSADMFYPCDDYKWVTERDPNKLGFYRIVLKQREDLPNVLPLRDFNDK